MLSVNSIYFEDDITVVTLHNAPAEAGFLHEIFGEIAAAGVSLDMISQTAPTGENVSIAFTMSDEDFPKALKVIGSLKAKKSGMSCEVSSGNSKVVFYDKGMPEVCGVGGEIYGVFSRAGVQIKLVTTSSDTVSVLFERYSTPELKSEIEKSVTIR